MTEPSENRDLAEWISLALHGLRSAVRELVPLPPVAAIQGAAERARRVRRTRAAVAIAAVALVFLAATWALPPEPSEPVPGESPSDAVSSSEPAVNPSDAPPPGPIDPDGAVLDVPANPMDESCAFGRLRLAGGSAHQEGRHLTIRPLGGEYDLTGTDTPTIVRVAGCSSNGYWIDREYLLALTRRDDGTLVGMWMSDDSLTPCTAGAVICPAVHYDDVWNVDQVVYAQAYGYGHDVLGEVMAFRWDGTAFVKVAQSRYPALEQTGETPAPPVRLGPIAAGTGCPAGTVRFEKADDSSSVSFAAIGGARYDTAQSPQGWVGGESDEPWRKAPWTQLSDRRLLVTRINCTRPDGTRTGGVAVFAPDGTGLTAIDFVRLDKDVLGSDAVPYPDYLRWWRFRVVGNGELQVNGAFSGVADKDLLRWVWDGTHFRRIQ
jgi:hypothetical protein